jgi:hypothetical protein
MTLARLRLLALAARNQVLRILHQFKPMGAVLPAPYTPAQVSNAKDGWVFWRGKGGPKWVCGSCVGNNDGEDSFNDKARGDHDQAGGMSQWHKTRHDIIEAHTGIDVWTASSAQQREAMFAEMTQPWSAYKHIWAELLATKTVEEAITILVEKYEQSGSQARDIARRTALANYWISYAEENGW